MIDNDDLKYLRRAGCSESVIRHSVAVAEHALLLAGRVRIDVDRALIKTGAVNHDIGRAKTQELDHFIVGAEIAERLGLDKRVVRIIERHIGAGIPEEEAAAYGLPPKDYIPETPEEIIVSYADNLTHHTTRVPFETALERFRTRLGAEHPAIERLIEMHGQMQEWILGGTIVYPEPVG